MLDLLADYPEVTAVGGLTLGADPIVGATLALAATHGRPGLRGFLVRKQAKTHGTGNLVEGPLEPGSVVAIVDDVATTGGSSAQAIEAVEALGCKVALVAVVLDRLEGAAQAFESRGLVFRPLLTIRDLGVEPLKSRLTDLDARPDDTGASRFSRMIHNGDEPAPRTEGSVRIRVGWAFRGHTQGVQDRCRGQRGAARRDPIRPSGPVASQVSGGCCPSIECGWSSPWCSSVGS